MSSENGRRTHWLVRAVAVLLGVVFVLFGALCVAACLSMLAKGANAPAAAKVGVTVQVVATIIFALVAMTGVFLVWVGLRRPSGSSAAAVERSSAPAPARIESTPARFEVASLRNAPSSFASAASPNGYVASNGGGTATLDDEFEPPQEMSDELEPCGQFAEAAALVPNDDRPADRELGRFLASCGPEKDGEMYNYVSAGVYLLLALLCVIAPGRLIELKIDPALAAKLALIPAGMGIAAALLHLWGPLLGAAHSIELYECGLIERVGQKMRRLELSAIVSLRVQEWYEHRFAARTFNVKAQVAGQRQLEFNTALRGDAERIVTFLASKIELTEFVAFSPM